MEVKKTSEALRLLQGIVASLNPIRQAFEFLAKGSEQPIEITSDMADEMAARLLTAKRQLDDVANFAVDNPEKWQMLQGEMARINGIAEKDISSIV